MSKELVCTQCGSIGKVKTLTKGSMMIEIILWLCFLIPGFIYSAWRLSSKIIVCKECGSSNLIPANSPLGKQTLVNLGIDKNQISKYEIEAKETEEEASSFKRKMLFGFAGFILLVVLLNIFQALRN